MGDVPDQEDDELGAPRRSELERGLGSWQHDEGWGRPLTPWWFELAHDC